MNFSATHSDASNILKVKFSTLRKWREKVLIEGVHFHKLTPKAIRYDPEMLIMWRDCGHTQAYQDVIHQRLEAIVQE